MNNYTRRGIDLHIHPGLVEELPKNIFLDGELWLGRNTFFEITKIFGSTDLMYWPHLKFVKFF